MFLLLRIGFLAIFVVLLIVWNRQFASFSFFGAIFQLPVGIIILASVLSGLLLNRWYESFRQFNLLDIIKEYSKKVTLLEKALEIKEKEQDRKDSSTK